MHVVIVGCGRVGSSISRRLLDDGHSVALIDTDPQAFEKRFPEGFAGTKVVGFGFDRDVLAQAGIDHAQALAAVTSGDNSNIIVARIARETYQVEHVVARIYDPGRALVYRRLGIPTIATVEWTTDQAMRRLFPSETRTEWLDPTGGVAIVERTLPAAWAGRALDAFDDAARWRLVAITRGGKATLPTGNVIGQEGDVLLLSVVGSAGDELDAMITAGPKGH
ncbi:MAG TPA: TrkA family potassium uptake protein [Acidimicrobiales bacterium]|nr:TrkA family potassium uptake protein [Acidimicrobiales bacterium]